MRRGGGATARPTSGASGSRPPSSSSRRSQISQDSPLEGNQRRSFVWRNSQGSQGSPANSEGPTSPSSLRRPPSGDLAARSSSGLLRRSASDLSAGYPGGRLSVFSNEYVEEDADDIQDEFDRQDEEEEINRRRSISVDRGEFGNPRSSRRSMQKRVTNVLSQFNATRRSQMSLASASAANAKWLQKQVASVFGDSDMYDLDDDDCEDMSDDPDEDPKFKTAEYTGRYRTQMTKFEMVFGINRPLSTSKRRALELKAKEQLKVAIDADDVEPTRIKIARRLGLLPFIIRKEVKKIRVEDEPPNFPQASSLVKSLKFELIIGGILILSCVSVGMNTYYEDYNRPLELTVIEHVFVFIFLIELMLRIMTYSWPWLFEFYNVCDVAIILLTGVLALWFLDPLGIPSGPLKRFAALRVLRLVRLCRAVRVIPTFTDLWTLVQGVIGSAGLLFWAFVLIFAIHFMFAVAMVDVVAKSDTFINDADVQEWFGSLMPAMFTLFQTMTVDSWAGKARPIMLAMPFTAVIFLLFIGIAGILLFNLMTAIIVKQSIDAKEKDIEAVSIYKHIEFTKAHKELNTIFRDMDEDGSGNLTREEFLDVLDDVSFVRKMKMLDIDLQELPEVFEILDDGDGLVSANEFCSGLMRMQGPPQNKEMLRATKLMAKREKACHHLRERFQTSSESSLNAASEDLNKVHMNICEMQLLTAEMLSCLDKTGLRGVIQKSTVEMPSFVARPTMESIQKEERAQEQRMANEPGMHKPKPLEANEVQLPPQSWIKRYHDEKQGLSAETLKPASAPKPPPMLLAGGDAGSPDAPQAPESQPSPLAMPDELADVKGELYGIAATLRDRFEALSLQPERWTKNALKVTANIPKDDLMRSSTNVECIHNRIVNGPSELEESTPPHQAPALLPGSVPQ
eukprot:TRINITY_DN54108_c0_g1_i1.p1 TRINITY_DN54108_c0_g1~~TRINITY_DN54108_c0_g1_i1.p1  ORF type:complete len:909 (-),score=158.18 TRINITY_DN54108_c0_g1_i1:315-3041(-)